MRVIKFVSIILSVVLAIASFVWVFAAFPVTTISVWAILSFMLMGCAVLFSIGLLLKRLWDELGE